MKFSLKSNAWKNVAEDFNRYLAKVNRKSKKDYPRLIGTQAKKSIEKAIANFIGYDNCEDFVSGHSFADPEVVAKMVKLKDLKSQVDSLKVSSPLVKCTSKIYITIGRKETFERQRSAYLQACPCSW
jgi:hypothetical protein